MFEAKFVEGVPFIEAEELPIIGEHFLGSSFKGT